MKSFLIKRYLLFIKRSANIALALLSLKATWKESTLTLNCNLKQKEINGSPENNPTNGKRCSALCSKNINNGWLRSRPSVLALQ